MIEAAVISVPTLPRSHIVTAIRFIWAIRVGVGVGILLALIILNIQPPHELCKRGDDHTLLSSSTRTSFPRNNKRSDDHTL